MSHLHHPTLLHNRLPYFGRTGLVRNGLVAEYRFDECRNLVKYSQQFDNAAWMKIQSTVTANATTAPDGTTTADKIIEKTGTDLWYHVYQAVASLTNSTVYTGSVYAKAGERTWIALKSRDKNNATIYSYFNLSTGVKGTTGSGHTANMISSGDGWYRCSISWNVNTGATTPEFIIMIAEGDADHTYNGDGTSGIYIWGAQLELGSVARTYYPTTDKQLLMDYSRPRKNLLLPNQANACEDGTTTGFIGGAGGTITAVAGEVDEWQGAYCLKVVTPNVVSGEGVTSSTYRTSTLPDRSYTASCYIRGSAGGETLRLNLYERTDANDTVGVTLSSPITLTTEWQRVSVTRTFGATGRLGYIYLVTSSQQSATFYVDGLQLEEGSTATAWEAPPNIGILGSTTGADTNDPTYTGQGASFTTDDYISLPVLPIGGSGNITIIAVAYSLTSTDAKTVFAQRSTSSANPSITLGYLSTEKVYAQFRDDANNSIYPADSSALSDGWYCITVVKTGNTGHVYLNGSLRASNTNESYTGAQTFSTSTIGASISTSTLYYFNSGIAYLAVYNRALTQAEITQNYNYLKGYLLRERGISI